MMTTGCHTPWGPAQTVTHHTDDVVSVTTASHGGFYVAHRVKQTWPDALRNIETFGDNGPLWYEEDLDAAIVVLAMPDLFDARAVRECLRGIVGWAKGSGNGARYAPILTWIGEERTKVESIAASWEIANAEAWLPRGLSSCDEGWRVSFVRVRDGERTTRTLKRYPEHQIYAELPGVAS